ncbi:MAG TPA: trehalose-6-phosphate synthase [Vicinamibacterales bacterium]|nr:trehalose-6-phosphate synthase [Vicinamibacterales bacterium]
MPQEAKISGHPLVVVSNREPYVHQRGPEGDTVTRVATGGVAVALDSLMRERGGTWIAHGSGDADRDTVDANDRVRVPPGEESYTLRRVWLSPEEERRYYGGFSNEGLWPLCHIAHVRPIFRSEDWAEYRAVNARFADAIATELSGTSQPVFIHDYHLALVAAELRRRRPGVRTALFWHIPWPHPDRLRMCPWRREIMTGLLANDLLAFQLDRDRRNFQQAVRDELHAESERGVVRFEGRVTHIVAAPIGVDFDRITRFAQDPGLEGEMARLRRELRLDGAIVGVGVDRLDYTKGIPERLDAIDRLLTRRPDLRSKVLFVQIGVPSRSKLESYAAIEHEIDGRIADINRRHGTGPSEGPIRMHKAAMKLRRLVALYRLANFCVVSSLHDGMNLVAKEFVASRDDNDGVLVLSELTGAAQELKDALLINPYDADGFARAIGRAIEMPAPERHARMRVMRRAVAGHDVFVWASDILDNLDRIGSGAAGAPLTPRPPRSVKLASLRPVP